MLHHQDRWVSQGSQWQFTARQEQNWKLEIQQAPWEQNSQTCQNSSQCIFFTHLHYRRKWCLYLVLFPKLSSLASKNQETVPTSTASQRCPWLPGLFFNLLLTPLSLLDRRKREIAFPFLCAMPTSFLISIFFFLL